MAIKSLAKKYVRYGYKVFGYKVCKIFVLVYKIFGCKIRFGYKVMAIKSLAIRYLAIR